MREADENQQRENQQREAARLGHAGDVTVDSEREAVSRDGTDLFEAEEVSREEHRVEGVEDIGLENGREHLLGNQQAVLEDAQAGSTTERGVRLTHERDVAEPEIGDHVVLEQAPAGCRHRTAHLVDAVTDVAPHRPRGAGESGRQGPVSEKRRHPDHRRRERARVDREEAGGQLGLRCREAIDLDRRCLGRPEGQPEGHGHEGQEDFETLEHEELRFLHSPAPPRLGGVQIRGWDYNTIFR